MNSFFLVLFFPVMVCSDSPFVKLEEGEISGINYELPNGRLVNAFLRVPYASPPVGYRRFKEPVPHKPWIGLWNASKMNDMCLQIDHRYHIGGKEDCLYLNIYTPKLPENDVSPLMNVIVLIHGGAFMFGSGDMKPDYMLQASNIVFVTFAYRLGVLGFFSTGDTVVPGNNGLKDQVKALKWIKRNIIHFGGNPSSVTILGSSAGGASVHYHYLSPISDGLFQKGISGSGSALPPWTLPWNVTEKSHHLAAIIGCPTTSTIKMVTCLKQRPATKIVEATVNFIVWRYAPFTSFGPVVEPPNPHAFLTSKPIDLLRNGQIKPIPWLTSLTNDEGLYPAADFIDDESLLRELDQKRYDLFPNLLMYNFSVEYSEKNTVTDAVKKFYFKDESISSKTIKQVIQMFGDRIFYNDIVEAIKIHTRVSQQDTYCYLFNYKGKYSLSNKFTHTMVDYGISHGDDLHFITNYMSLSATETTCDKKMTELMTSIILNFMDSGVAHVNGKKWEPVSKNSPVRCLNINSATDYYMADLTKGSNVDFWKKLLPTEYPKNVAYDEL